MVCVNMQNKPANLLVLRCSLRRNRAKVLVVSASVDLKDTAEGLDTVLETQLMNGVQSLAECGVNMAIAFFKIRFSSSSCALRFWSSLTCFAVRTSPLSISTVEYCLTHLPSADWETPYSLQSWAWVLPFCGEIREIS